MCNKFSCGFGVHVNSAYLTGCFPTYTHMLRHLFSNERIYYNHSFGLRALKTTYTYMKRRKNQATCKHLYVSLGSSASFILFFFLHNVAYAKALKTKLIL